MDDKDEDRRRRGQGPRLPPQRRPAGDLPRLQGLQHPARLGKQSSHLFPSESRVQFKQILPVQALDTRQKRIC